MNNKRNTQAIVKTDGKVTTKTIEKIGSYDEIKKICGDMEPLKWAKQYIAKRSKYKFGYDLNDILSMLVFARVIYPGSKKSSLELS